MMKLVGSSCQEKLTKSQFPIPQKDQISLETSCQRCLDCDLYSHFVKQLLDTRRKLNVHRTFSRRLGHLLNVLATCKRVIYLVCSWLKDQQMSRGKDVRHSLVRKFLLLELDFYYLKGLVFFLKELFDLDGHFLCEWVVYIN